MKFGVRSHTLREKGIDHKHPRTIGLCCLDSPGEPALAAPAQAARGQQSARTCWAVRAKPGTRSKGQMINVAATVLAILAAMCRITPSLAAETPPKISGWDIISVTQEAKVSAKKSDPDRELRLHQFAALVGTAARRRSVVIPTVAAWFRHDHSAKPELPRCNRGN
jgi:hypothetical protein